MSLATIFEFANENCSRPLPVVQISRYVGNRFGVLALSNLPIIWVFGARNNPFTWLTGWPFATFNLFHRWAARLATIEAIAHGICYSIAYAYQGIYYDNWLARWFFCGVIVSKFVSCNHEDDISDTPSRV